MGFEPTYDGFANHCLTAWLPHLDVRRFQRQRPDDRKRAEDDTWSAQNQASFPTYSKPPHWRDRALDRLPGPDQERQKIGRAGGAWPGIRRTRGRQLQRGCAGVAQGKWRRHWVRWRPQQALRPCPNCNTACEERRTRGTPQRRRWRSGARSAGSTKLDMATKRARCAF